MNSRSGIGIAHAFGLNKRRPFRCTFPKSQFGALVPDLEGTEIVNQIPGLFGLDYVGKGRHRRSVDAGHEDFVEIAIAGTALETVTGIKVVRADRLIVAIGKSVR